MGRRRRNALVNKSALAWLYTRTNEGMKKKVKMIESFISAPTK